MTYFQDHEWYDGLMDETLKDEALEQKAIYEKSWGDASQSVINFCAWLKRSFRNFHELDYELLVKLQDYWWKVNDREWSPFSTWRDHIRGPYTNFYATHDPYIDINQIFGGNSNRSFKSDVQEDEEHEINKEGYKLFNDNTHEWPVYEIRRFEMIMYSFGEDEKYVAIKELEYNDLMKTDEWLTRRHISVHDMEYHHLSCKVWDEWEVHRYGNANLVIMEYLVKISKRAHTLELKQRNIKKLTLTSYAPYPSRKIRRICALHFTRNHEDIKSNTPLPINREAITKVILYSASPPSSPYDFSDHHRSL
ncbi:hypothetical protein Tco_0861978, partial [Tanacetum coccineum]